MGEYGRAIGNLRGDYGEHTGEYIGKYGKDVPPVTPHDPALHATPRSPLPHFPPPRPTWGHPNGQPPPLPPPTPDAARGRLGRVRDIRGKEPGQTRVQREENGDFRKISRIFQAPSRIFPYFTISVKEPPGQRPCLPRHPVAPPYLPGTAPG